MDENIVEKITKLLALSESPNENEARAAMLKARQLMAEHKLRPEDVTAKKSETVVKRTIGIFCTKMTDTWAVRLNQLVAGHYCCIGYRHRVAGEKKVELGLIGLSEDFAICERIAKYAHESVKSRCNDLKRLGRKSGMNGPDIREACNSYGWGFCAGLAEAYDRQTREHQEWGLVLSVPKPVNDAAGVMNSATFLEPSLKRSHEDFVRIGYADGREFDPATRIAEAEQRKALA